MASSASVKSFSIISVNEKDCVGCRICEISCSSTKEGYINPDRSRIRVMRLQNHVDLPVLCRQCEDAPCIKACKDDAIARAADNTIAIDPERCTNCGLCVRACPFDAIFLHPDTECVVTCDLCSGTPVCVKYCPTKCITYSSWEESLEAERGSETTLYKSLI